MRQILDFSEEAVQDRVKFLVHVKDKEADEIMTYNELVDFLHVDASYFETLDADCLIDTSTRSSDNDTVDDTDAKP